MRGPFCTPITPLTGSLLHAGPHACTFPTLSKSGGYSACPRETTLQAVWLTYTQDSGLNWSGQSQAQGRVQYRRRVLESSPRGHDFHMMSKRQGPVISPQFARRVGRYLVSGCIQTTIQPNPILPKQMRYQAALLPDILWPTSVDPLRRLVVGPAGLEPAT